MTEPQAARRFAQTAQKWRDLVNRRCAQFLELHRSGGWKYHYDETRFLRLMREALALCETWRKLAPRPEDGEGATAVPAGPAENPPRRTAA
jgi:hypothetical protein